MWNIFLAVILICVGVVAVATTLFILATILDTLIKQFKNK